jgi:hypothetical protein
MAESEEASNDPDSTNNFIIRSLSISLSLVIVVGLFFQLRYQQCNLLLVHVAVASIFAISGILITKIPEAKYSYIIAGSLNWYGVFYSFISTETEISWHHFVQPEIVIAFLAFASSLLTIPELNNSKKLLSDPILNSSALLVLLTYFWVIEVYFVMQSHQFFVDGVMSKMPHRLSNFTLFSDHRVTYSTILLTCHYCNVSLCLAMSNDNPEFEAGSADCSADDLRKKIEKKILSRNRSKTDTSQSSNQRNENNDDNSHTARQQHTESEEEVMSARSKLPDNDGKIKLDNNKKDTELPPDCLEITYEEAVELGGFFDDTFPVNENSGSV